PSAGRCICSRGQQAVLEVRTMSERDEASFPTDYDAYAPTYAWARRALPLNRSSGGPASCQTALVSSKLGVEQETTSERWPTTDAIWSMPGSIFQKRCSLRRPPE